MLSFAATLASFVTQGLQGLQGLQGVRSGGPFGAGKFLVNDNCFGDGGKEMGGVNDTGQFITFDF